MGKHKKHHHPESIAVPDVPSLFPNATELGMNEVKSVEVMMTSRLLPDTTTEYSFPCTDIEMNAGNQNWTASWTRNPDMSLNFHLTLDPKNPSTIWSLKAHVTLFLRNKSDTERCVDKICRDKMFKYNEKSIVFEISNKDFFQLFSRWVDGETTQSEEVVIEVQICVVQTMGFRNRSRITYDFGTKNDDSDLKLVINQTRAVYVDIGYLAQLSGYFSSLRRRLSDLPREQSINLPFEKLDVDYDEFVTLLLAVYPSKLEINDSNVSYLLVLADRFLFEGLLSDIEKYLISPQSKAIDVFTKLQWSCTYQMADLQGYALSLLPSRLSIMAVKESPIYSNLSVDVMTCLFERLIDKSIP